MGDVDYTDLDYRSLKTFDHSVTGQTVNWDDYIAYKHEKSKSEAILHPVDPVAASQPSDSEDADQNAKVLSFAEISALIESGQTHLIPNNEIIPQGLNVRKISPTVTTILSCDVVTGSGAQCLYSAEKTKAMGNCC